MLAHGTWWNHSRKGRTVMLPGNIKLIPLARIASRDAARHYLGSNLLAGISESSADRIRAIARLRLQRQSLRTRYPGWRALRLALTPGYFRLPFQGIQFERLRRNCHEHRYFAHIQAHPISTSHRRLTPHWPSPPRRGRNARRPCLKFGQTHQFGPALPIFADCLMPWTAVEFQ
jgi:hypothetical protein